MKIGVVGSGYVGLITGACLADFGHHVTCVDKNAQRIKTLKNGQSPFFEPGLKELLAKTQGRLFFSEEPQKVAASCDVIFIAVGTPETPTGDADTTAVFQVVEEVAPFMRKEACLVLKSTVPIGTNRQVCKTLERLNCEHIHVVSNPEFLREGSAIYDFQNPDRLIIGTTSDHAQSTMSGLYQPLIKKGVPLLSVAPETAETIKYAANSFLAIKITFINQIADLCEAIGADVLDVAKGIGLDKRINPHFLHPGPGYGGSCFPKDTRALCATAHKKNINLSLVKEAINANNLRKGHMVEKIKHILEGTIRGKTLGVLGITFKAHTDDTRESPALAIIEALLAQGAIVQAFDPQAPENLKDKFDNFTLTNNANQAAQNADALIILTEWPVFQDLNFSALKNTMRNPLLIDFRNLYQRAAMKAINFPYIGLGQISHSSDPL